MAGIGRSQPGSHGKFRQVPARSGKASTPDFKAETRALPAPDRHAGAPFSLARSA
jgi:hypothetical protein